MLSETKRPLCRRESIQTDNRDRSETCASQRVLVWNRFIYMMIYRPSSSSGHNTTSEDIFQGSTQYTMVFLQPHGGKNRVSMLLEGGGQPGHDQVLILSIASPFQRLCRRSYAGSTTIAVVTLRPVEHIVRPHLRRASSFYLRDVPSSISNVRPVNTSVALAAV